MSRTRSSFPVRIPAKLARAIRAMPSDQPGPVIETIERAGFAIVPERDLVELRRAWQLLSLPGGGLGTSPAFDRLRRAAEKVWR